MNPPTTLIVAAVTVALGATLDLNNFSETVGSLAGAVWGLTAGGEAALGDVDRDAAKGVDSGRAARRRARAASRGGPSDPSSTAAIPATAAAAGAEPLPFSKVPH